LKSVSDDTSKNLADWSSQFATCGESPIPILETQLAIHRTHNETPSVVAMRVSNPRSSACTPVANCGVDLISDVLPFGRLWCHTRLRLDSFSAQGCADSSSKSAQTQVSASRCACL
jgi:hypothetical protein